MWSRQLSHDPALTLSTCTVARPCGFSLTTESSTVPLFAWPVSSSPAGVAGDGFRFGRRSHGSFAGFCLQPDVPGPCMMSVRHRLAALLCGSAAALMGFCPSQFCSGEISWRKVPRQPTCRLLDFAGPGLLSSQGPAGVFGSFCVPASRGLSIAAPGSSGSPAVPSRRVGIGRYCLGLCLFQGCRA